MTDYSRDFLSFFMDRFEVAGDYGPLPLVDPAIKAFLRKAFTKTGEPRYGTVADFRIKKSGKSVLAGCVGLYMACRRDDAEVAIASSSREQSKDRVLRIIKYAVRKLIDSGRPFWKDVVIGNEFIRFPNHSIIQALGQSWKSSAGGNWSCVVHDELHTQTLEIENRRFDELLVPPQIKGIRWLSSYAGFLNESALLRTWWDLGLEGERVSRRYPIYENDDFLALIDCEKSAWRYPWMNEAAMAKIQKQERPKSYRRLWLNQWTSSEGEFIEPALWDACFVLDGPLAPNKKIPVFIGLDLALARQGDDSGAVGVFPMEDGRVGVAFHKTWSGKRTSELKLGETIEPWLIHKAQQFYVAGVYYDPHQGARLVENLRHYMSCFPVTQSLPVLGPLGNTLYEMIKNQALLLYDAKELRHAPNDVIAREVPSGLHLKKASRTHKVDLMVALSFVAGRAWSKRLTGPRLIGGIRKKSRWTDGSWQLPAHGHRGSRFTNIGGAATRSRWRRQ